jgi:uncharacterized protein YggE
MKNSKKFKLAALAALMVAAGVMTTQADELMPNPAMLNLGRAGSFALLSDTAITSGSIDSSGTGAKWSGF